MRNEYQKKIDKLNAKIRSYERAGLKNNQLYIQLKKTAHTDYGDAIKIKKDKNGKEQIRVSQSAKYQKQFETKLNKLLKFESYKKDVAIESQQQARERHEEFKKKYGDLTDTQADLMYKILNSPTVRRLTDKKTGKYTSDMVADMAKNDLIGTGLNEELIDDLIEEAQRDGDTELEADLKKFRRITRQRETIARRKEQQTQMGTQTPQMGAITKSIGE